MDAAQPGAGHNRLAAIDPEKLLTIDLAEIHPLLDAQFPQLAVRADELEINAEAWVAAHTVNGVVTIADDAQMNEATDLYAQLRTFAGDKGELEETRVKISHPLYQANQAVNGWFKNRAANLIDIMGTITKAQKARAQAKIREEQLARQAEVAAAEARRVEALLAARAAAPEHQEQAVQAAYQAEDAVAEAQQAAAASVKEITRTFSTLGTSTSASEVWTYEVEDIRALCRAVADGNAPFTWVQVNDSAVKLAIKGKSGIREIAGLRIYADVKLNRRGG